MSRLRNLIKGVLSTPPKQENNDCCNFKKRINKGTTLSENINKRVIMTENMQYHVQNQLPLTENTFRYGSKAFLDLWSEARYLYVRDAINVNELDQEILTETHLGEYGIFEGEKEPLDLPMVNAATTSFLDIFVKSLKKVIQQKFKAILKITIMPDKSIVILYPRFLAKQLHPFFDSLMKEGAIGDFVGIGVVVTDVKNRPDNTTLKLATQPFKNNPLLEKKNTKKLNKPMRDSSGGKAYKVYVKDPKTGNIKTVRFGSGGLKAKINNSKARQAFSKRHDCPNKNDKTKASYWSCRLPRYAKLLGLKSSFSGFW